MTKDGTNEKSSSTSSSSSNTPSSSSTSTTLFCPLSHSTTRPPALLSNYKWNERDNQSISLNDAIRAYIHADLDVVFPKKSFPRNKTSRQALPHPQQESNAVSKEEDVVLVAYYQDKYKSRREKEREWVQHNPNDWGQIQNGYIPHLLEANIIIGGGGATTIGEDEDEDEDHKQEERDWNTNYNHTNHTRPLRNIHPTATNDIPLRSNRNRSTTSTTAGTNPIQGHEDNERSEEEDNHEVSMQAAPSEMDERKEETIKIVSEVIKQYKKEGIKMSDIEIIPIPSLSGTTSTQQMNLTIRRICFAVFTVISAFVCIMLQALPLSDGYYAYNAIFDTGSFGSHLYSSRRDVDFSSKDRLLHDIMLWKDVSSATESCGQECSSNGVLHIDSSTTKKGVMNHSWILPCGTNVPNNTTSPSQKTHACFRGVYDDLFTRKEQTDLVFHTVQLLFASSPSEKDAVKEDLSFHVPHLYQYIQPTVIHTLRTLLQDQYDSDPTSTHGVPTMEPVAYHVSVTFPKNIVYEKGEKGFMDALWSNRFLQYNATIMNIWQEYVDTERNHMSFSPTHDDHTTTNTFKNVLQSLFYHILPFQRMYHYLWKKNHGDEKYQTIDPCIFTSDLDAHPDFMYHTAIFLTSGMEEGIGSMYSYNHKEEQEHHHHCASSIRGNEILYINNDDPVLNDHPRNKIQKGLLIDPAFGRVVISTGGYENRRCKLPLREVRSTTTASSRRRRVSGRYDGSSGMSASPRIVLRIWWKRTDDAACNLDSRV